GIDRTRAAERAQHNGGFEFAAARVGHVAEPEGFALGVRQSAELQPHQRHELRVLADLLIDYLQQPAPRQLAAIFAEIQIPHLNTSGSAESCRATRSPSNLPGTAARR